MAADDTVQLSTLDVYDIAFLAGGPARLLDTAVVALVEAGRVRVGPTGLLYATQLHRSSPVEAAVLDCIGTRGRSVHTVRWRVADDARMAAVADRLQREGLVRPARWPRRRSPSGGWRLTAAGGRVLRRLRAAPAGGDPALRAVALSGAEQMRDAGLRIRVFGIVAPRRVGVPFRGHVTDYAFGVEATAYAAMPHVVHGGGFDTGGFDTGCGGFDGGGGDGGGC
jgi:hypothetical protein